MSIINSKPASPLPHARSIVRVLKGKHALLKVVTNYRGKSGGYFVERKSIQSILDRTGKEVEPRWETTWTRIAPGIYTRKEDRGTRRSLGVRSSESHVTGSLRIYHRACPVSVQIRMTWEYNDYDTASFSSQENDAWWIRYEAD